MILPAGAASKSTDPHSGFQTNCATCKSKALQRRSMAKALSGGVQVPDLAKDFGVTAELKNWGIIRQGDKRGKEVWIDW